MSNNNAKKKQEDKHLKMLRDFLTIPANKQCFDCNQKGPTYVNTTIGSFVCVSCSGKLRGLTPPHRVKSITMASFTAEEIEFLKIRGNEYCQQVWMAHYPSSSVESETRDVQKFKDFLMNKYEKKRWYADPGTTNKLSSTTFSPKQNGSSHNESLNSSSTEIQSSTLITQSPTRNDQPSATSKSSVLLADLDFFNLQSSSISPIKKSQPISYSVSQPSFANFQNADFFTSTFSPPKPVAQNPVNSGMNGFGSPINNGMVHNNDKMNGSVPPEDRYSALKDLDALVLSQNETSTNWGNSWNPTTSTANTSSSIFPPTVNSGFGTVMPTNQSSFWNSPPTYNSAPQFTNGNSSNPFFSAPALQPGTQALNASFARPAVPWANFSTSPMSTMNVPAHDHLFALNGYSGSSGISGLTSSTSLPLASKTWASTGHNPFTENTAMNAGRSHNPFL